jgi:hypothetical protein
MRLLEGHLKGRLHLPVLLAQPDVVQAATEALCASGQRGLPADTYARRHTKAGNPLRKAQQLPSKPTHMCAGVLCVAQHLLGG